MTGYPTSCEPRISWLLGIFRCPCASARNIFVDFRFHCSVLLLHVFVGHIRGDIVPLETEAYATDSIKRDFHYLGLLIVQVWLLIRCK
jgi:hypothetical protein